ncbi:MAG TPA: PAS domain S-box protein, partial [Burkholderiaceae bacterium]
MSETKPNAADWRERCHAALDLMRDDPMAAQAIGLAILAELPPKQEVPPGRLQRLKPLQYLEHLDLADQRKFLGGELTLAIADFFLGKYDAAERELNRLEELFRIVNDLRSLALCLYAKISVWRAAGRTREAYDLGYTEALPIVAHFQTREKVIVLNAMGVVCQEYDRADESIRHFYSALELARKLGLDSRVAHISANIGEILYMSGNSEEAELILEEARSLAQQSPERWLLPFTSCLLALCKIATRKYAEAHAAVQVFLPSVDAGKIGFEATNRGFCLSVAAYALAMRGQIDEAEQLSEQAYALLDLYQDKQEKPYTWWVRGHVLHRRGRLEEAIAALEQAIAMNGELGFYFMPQHALLELVEIHEEMGNWQLALRAHQRYHDSYARAQNQSTRARLQVLHIQGELKEAENARRRAEATMAERDTILDNSMVGIVFLNARGCVQWSNRAMSDMLRTPHGDNMDQSFEQYFPSRAEYRRMGAQVIEAVRNNSIFETEYEMCRRDGSVFWAWISGRAVDPADPARGTVWVALDISMRRKLEEDLQKSEEQHRQVLNNVTEGIIVVQNGLMVYANPRAWELTGTPPEEVMNKPFLPYVHPDEQAMVMEQHMRRLRGEEVEQYYAFRIKSYGADAYRWVEISGVMIQWEGAPATLAFISDITDRKRLEHSLTESLEERDIILENSMVGIAFLTPQGRVRWSNRTMQEMLGTDNANKADLSLEPFYPSREEYLHVGGEAAQAIARGQPFETELRLVRHDGTPFWAWISGRSVKANDLTQGTVWVIVDIDKRHRLEIDLQKSEEHHRQVVDNVTEGIMVTQGERIVFANPRVAQIAGRSLEQIFAMPAYADVHPEDLEALRAENACRLRGEATSPYYAFRMIRHITGAERWVELSAVVIDWEGEPASLAFLTDITDRRALEHSLRESHLERVRLQTLQFETELKEAEMARRHAEETTKAKSMFLANMSHEIRTPMNAIIGMAHLALRSQLEPKQRDYVEKIHTAGISLLGIINDVLDLSKIEAGKLVLDETDFLVAGLLKSVSQQLADKALNKGL